MTTEGFSFWTAVAFTVNYIMGCGFLGVPHAFVASGIVLGPLVIVLFGYLVNLTKDFVLDAMARTEAITKLRRGEITLNELQDEHYLVNSERTFEVTDLFGLLMGSRARFAYMLFLSGYMYGALWAYGTVFASSFTANVPLPGFNDGHTCNVETDGSACIRPFLLWLGVFGLIAVPLACMELKEQISVQVLMFIARVLVVLLMTGTVLAGYRCDGVVFTDQGTDHAMTTPLAIPAGLSTVIPISTYAFIFHHSVPVLSQPVADKKSLPRVFLAAFLITGTAYAALGTILAVWFGETVQSQSNLNWHYYVGCQPAGTTDATNKDTGANIISFVILIFPALDVLSAYPLNAVTLGNNLMSACFPAPAYSAETAGKEGGEPAAGTSYHSRWLRVTFRLIAAIPPIIAGGLSTLYGINLGQILQFTGLIGVAIAFGIPSLLWAWSYAAMARVKKVDDGVQGGRAGADEGEELIDMAQRGAGFDGSASKSGVLVPGITWREVVRTPWRTPADMSTPYSHWLTRHGAAKSIFLFSIAMAIFVAVQMGRGEG